MCVVVCQILLFEGSQTALESQATADSSKHTAAALKARRCELARTVIHIVCEVPSYLTLQQNMQRDLYSLISSEQGGLLETSI